jgi:hypothetical protein
MKIGDKVKYVGSGVSALDGGPGEVAWIGNRGAIRVRILHEVLVVGNHIKRGEELWFGESQLEVVE